MAYKSSYTGPQIDQAVGNALVKDTTTLSNDVNHIPASSVVKSAIGELVKYKDYTKTDTYVAGELGTVANLDSDGITGYTPIFAMKIEPINSNTQNEKALIPFIYNYYLATRLMVYCISTLSTAQTYKYRVYFIKNTSISSGN